MARNYIMFQKTYFIILLLFYFKCQPILGKLSEQKSSLIFVIDDTNSMSDDIQQVKTTAKSILDTVINSKATQIGNYVLVRFNDPDIKSAFVTTNKEEYITALDNIVVSDGGDCPELAMKGIEEALDKGLPRSYLFVFTDASAKDYGNFEKVKRLAQKKSCQIIFILTGICTTKEDPAYQVYHQLATATSGQVFDVDKNEVTKVLEYVKEIVKFPRTDLGGTEFGPGYGNTIHFPADDMIGNVIISISGQAPKVEVIGPDGIKPATSIIVQTANVVVIKIDSPRAGTYTVIVGSLSITHVIITGATIFDFLYGFSSTKPASIEDTVSRPIAGKSLYLAIEPDSPGNIVELKEVNLVDLNKNVLRVLPLKKVRDDFYVTEPVVTPDAMFKILVKGVIKSTNIPVQRISATPIEPQKPESAPVKAPTITSVGDILIKINYGKPLQLRCKVSAFPKPRIVWVSEKSGHVLSEMVEEVDLPYDYVSILKINQVKESITYQCRAFNEYGEDRKSVQVEAITKFVVVDVSKDLSILYRGKGSLKCVIDAIPSAQITWYFGGSLLNELDKDIELSSDKTVLTITNMEPRFEGEYSCEAKNELNKQVFPMRVTMADKAPPQLIETVEKIEVKENQSLDMSCKVIAGVPPPKIRWLFQKQDTLDFIELSDTSDVIHIPVADRSRSGIYRCEAYNAYGTASKDITVVVLYPPKIKDDEKLVVSTEQGKIVNLDCEVSGVPPPTVKWTFNGGNIEFTHTIYKNKTLSFKASVANTGNFSCEASNELGSARRNVEVIVYGAPMITPPEKTRLQKIVGCSLTLTCEVFGFPKPTIKWLYYNKETNKRELRTIDDSGSLHIPRLEVSHSGSYVCLAQNSLGSANVTYTVDVLSPPTIEKSPSDKVTVVVGDLVLKLPCPASGDPAPLITWTKDGLFVPSGRHCYFNTMFEIDVNVSLIIKDIDMTADGKYICYAENDVGMDFNIIYVNVLKTPPPGTPEKTIKVEIGTSPKINCDIPHIRTDILRWYKDSKLIASGNLTLNNAQLSDQGIYTCRVSTLSGSSSASVYVEVGSKPKFIYDEGGNLDLHLGEQTYLSCSARGVPTPKVSWKFNGKSLDVTTMVLSFIMSDADIGRYECVVTNYFGTVTREYNIVKKDY